MKKPFAGFKNLAVCINAQQKKGHPKDVAQKICRRLQSEEAQKHKAEKLSVFRSIPFEKDEPLSTFEVFRVGTIHDRNLKVTKKMLEDYVRNFRDNVYNGAELSVNMHHRTGTEAAGWIKDLFIDGQSLMMQVSWTELGREAIKKKLYKFISIETWPNVKHWKTGAEIKNVLAGAALTNDPALGGQKPILLEKISNLFHNKNNMNAFKLFLSRLADKEAVKKDDKKMLRSMFETLEEEEKEEVKEEVEEVEEKPEQTEEEKKAEEEKTAEAKKAGEEAAQAEEEKKKEEMSRKTVDEKVETLTNQVNEMTQSSKKMKEENEKMKKDARRVNLEKKFDSLIISNTRPVGFIKDSKDQIVELMETMTEEQVEKFIKAQEKMSKVDLSDTGKTGETPKGNKEEEEKLDKNIQKYMKENKCTYHEALIEVAPEGYGA